MSKVKKNRAAQKAGQGKPWLIWLVLAAFTFVLYGNSIPNDYNLDDELVTRNHKLTSKGISAIPEIFRSPYYADEQGYAYEYRPVVLTSFAIEHQFFGERAQTSHFINVLLYALTAILLYTTLTTLLAGYNRVIPLLTTLLFIAHPLHTEVVASIKNRDEILCFLFGILSLKYMLRFVNSKKLGQWLAAAIFFMLAMLSKSSIVAFSFLIPVAAVVFYRTQLRLILLSTLPLALVAAAFVPIFSVWDRLLLFAAICAVPLAFQLFLHQMGMMKKYFAKSRTAVLQWWRALSAAYSAGKEQLINRFFRDREKRMLFNAPWVVEDNRIHVAALAVGVAALSVSFLLQSEAWAYLASAVAFVPYLAAHNRHRNMGFILLVASVTLLSGFTATVEIPIILLPLILLHLVYDRNMPFVIPLLTLIPVYGVVYLSFPSIYPLMMEGSFMMLLLLVLFRLKRFWLLAPFLLIITLAGNLFDTFVQGAEAVIYQRYYAHFVLILFFLLWSGKKSFQYSLKALGSFSVVLILALSFISEGHIERTAPVASQLPVVTVRPKKGPPEKVISPQTPREANAVAAFISGGRNPEFPENPLFYEDDPVKKVSTAVLVLGRYLRLLLFPHPMRYYYGYREIEIVGAMNPWVILSLLAHLLLFVAGILLIRKYKALSLGILIYLFSIAAYSNLAAPVSGVMGDRLAYVASFGFCLALAALLALLFRVNLFQKIRNWRSLNTGFLGVTAVLLLLYSGKTISRNAAWKDHLTLFANDMPHLEESVQAHNLYASHLVFDALKEPDAREKRRRLLEAAEHYKRAVELYPNIHNFWYDLGRVYLYLNNHDMALEAFKRSSEIEPRFSDATLKAAQILDEQGKNNEAIKYYERAVEYNKSEIQAFINLSFIFFEMGDYEASIEVNKRAIEHNPQAYEPYVNIGKTYLAMGRNDLAVQYFERAAQINSRDKELLNILVELFHQQGNAQKANYYYNLLRQLP